MDRDQLLKTKMVSSVEAITGSKEVGLGHSFMGQTPPCSCGKCRLESLRPVVSFSGDLDRKRS